MPVVETQSLQENCLVIWSEQGECDKDTDLVMVEIEPQFKLDETFCGSYHVKSITSIDVVIKKVNDPKAEP